MNQTNVKAIVIANQDYKEKDVLATLFTLEQGVISVVFKGVKNSNAKLKSAKELFTFGDFIYANGMLNTITSANVVTNFYDITKSLPNFYAACNIAKIIKAVLPAGEANSGLFVDTLKCLNLLNDSTVKPNLVLIKFLVRVFEGFGYRFNLNKCSTCGSAFLNKRYINLNDGDITCVSCKMGRVEELSNAEYQSLRLISLTDYDNLNSLKISSFVIDRTLYILKLNFEHRFGQKLDEI
ncbi:MAG: DNA repair protein RecO [Clostridia bacterium]|nr:DNA repair protein RecO [Clostridia bacterium]